MFKAVSVGLGLVAAAGALGAGTAPWAQPAPAEQTLVTYRGQSYVLLGAEGCAAGQVRIRLAASADGPGQCVGASEVTQSPQVIVAPPSRATSRPPSLLRGPAQPAATAPSARTQGPLIGTEYALPAADLGPIPTLTVVMTPASANRNLALCRAFASERSYGELTAESRLARNIVPVRWLLTSDPGRYDDCDANTRLYDFDRGAKLLAEAAAALRAGGGSGAFTGRGPFFVEQFAGEDGLTYLVIDLSETDSADFGDLSTRLSQALAGQSAALAARPAEASAERRVNAATVPATAPSAGPATSPAVGPRATPATTPATAAVAPGAQPSTLAAAADLADRVRANTIKGCTALKSPTASILIGIFTTAFPPGRGVITVANRLCTASGATAAAS